MAHVEFIENKGQWGDNVIYKAKIPGGNLYLEQNELTYQFYNEQDMARLHDLHHEAIKNPKPQDFLMDVHAFKIKFLNAKSNLITPTEPTSDYVNYFLGNDKSKWASKVKKYKAIRYQQLYDDIDLKFYLKGAYLKYDFVVRPHANATQIQLKYDGVDNLIIEKGRLKITTSVNEIIEQQPYAYQIVRGKKKEVKCNFTLENNILSFEFPRAYDKSKELIIDPTLIFASYSGSSIDNWGYTSTFDDAGHLYGGGVSFGLGYPTTTGAYQINFGGGTSFFGCDITITKFSPNGTNLIYSTYLGGIDNESPHSLIVNSNNELLIMGTTSSPNYPTTLNALDTSFNGGLPYTGSIPYYNNGSDIIISKLSPNGATLLSSTFVGGTGNDGLNDGAVLQYNYADDYRGEIMVDANDNVYVASTTRSVDFPVSLGAFQSTYAGLLDGCVFKLSSDLSTLTWSSYIGGTDDDAAYSLQFNTLGEVLLTGGTSSADFPTTASTIQPNFQGIADGWITKINNSASTIVASTYIGTVDYDQTYFVQSDTGDNVYVVGQTEGTYPITPATVYNVPNSGQFIHKLTPDLSSTVFSTSFGNGSGEVDIALSAFLVNECNYIFVSGWGGYVNVSHGGAPFSTTTGLPTTIDALQTTTDGSDYYLMMLDENATALKFATFFGGGSSSEHVDGGTSRFDKKGIVYQAVCAGCWANSDFPTTTGAWSNTNNSTGCNLGVFKIDLTRLTADAEVYTTPFYCLNDTVHFQNLSNGGINYFWDFGDGNTSTAFEPYHPYDSVGTFHVMLVVLDSITCIQMDTDYVDVYIGGPPVATISPINGVCRGDSIQLGISGGLSYVWTPAYNILNDSTASPTVWPDTTTIYTVVTFDSCGTDTSQIIVNVFNRNISIQPDTLICLGQSAQLYATGGGSYSWSPIATLNNPNTVNPIATPTTSTTYTVVITDTNNCVWDTLMTVIVDNNMPNAQTSVDDMICFGDSIAISATGGSNFSWSPAATLSNPSDSLTMAFPSETTQYVIEVSNSCGIDYDSLLIAVHIVNANIVSDTIVCAGDRVNLWATGGTSYLWSSSTNIAYVTSSSFSPIITVPTTFNVDVTDSANCIASLTVFVDTSSVPNLTLGEDITTNWGTPVTLNPITNGLNFWWSPATGLSCTTCENPMVTSTESATYYLTVQGENGCFNYDTITVFFDGSIYVPNSFSPDGDGKNDIFYAYGKDIVEFDMYIFDRWGEQLFYSDDMSKGWDGIYKGSPAKTETYVWKVKYRDIIDNPGTMYGTVTLIR